MPEAAILERAQVSIRYGAFIEKEEMEAERHRKAAEDRLDPDMDYTVVNGLRIEAQQQLNAGKPLTIGQAQKTPGVTPGDISALLVHMSRIRSGPVQYGPYSDRQKTLAK
jgi:tRNA uridine 5-carboxymethylaminomethyl modification enzyme